MKKVQLIICVVISFFIFSATASASTYYVRTDGAKYGTDETHCNGLTNIAFSEAIAPNCAVDHPFEVLGVNNSDNYYPKIIVGGDTVIIANGSYEMGRHDIYINGACHENWNYGCIAQSIPSGTKENPTRIVGEDWENGCSQMPELFGTGRAARILDLTNSSNVEVQCLEITDHSSCGHNYQSGTGALSCDRSHPYDSPFADSGIVSGTVNEPYNTSENVLLKSLYIHGLGAAGLVIGHVKDWSIIDCNISYNAAAGLNGDTSPSNGLNDEFSGTMLFKDSKIDYNGCIEDWENDGVIVPNGCYGDAAGGYGDGVGTGPIGDAIWIFDNTSVSYNTSDGLDLLYGSRYPNSTVFIRNSLFRSNAGNQIKLSQSALVENNEIHGDCDYFKDKPFTLDGSITTCRGGGSAIVIVSQNGNNSYFLNNSFTGTGPVIFSATSNADLEQGTEEIFLYNNLFDAKKEHNSESFTDTFYLYKTTIGTEGRFYSDYNVYGNNLGSIRYGQCDEVNSNCGDDPFLLGDFDLRLTAESVVAIDKGMPGGAFVFADTKLGDISIPVVDRYGNSRDNADIGMHEYNGNPATCLTDFSLCENETDCLAENYNWCGTICQNEQCQEASQADTNYDSQINTIDAMLTLRNSLGFDMLETTWQSSATTGDVNCDGSSNAIDAVLLLRYSLGFNMSGTGWCE